MLRVALAALVAPLLAAWAHELTHAAAARLLGGEVVAISLVALFVDFKFEPRAPIRERLVLLAPAIVGLVTAPVALLLWDGTLTLWAFVAALAWTVYSLNGGAEGELRLTTS